MPPDLKTPLPDFYEAEDHAPSNIHQDDAPPPEDTVQAQPEDTVQAQPEDTVHAQPEDTLAGEEDLLNVTPEDPLFKEKQDTVVPGTPEDEPDPIDRIEDPKARESFAQKEAKRRGREAKELSVKVKELEMELAKLKEEKTVTPAVANTVPTIAELRQHPDVKPVIDSVYQDVESTSLLLTSKSETDTLKKNFGNWMQQVIDIQKLPEDERRTKMFDFRNQLEGEFGDNTGPVMQLFLRNVNKTLEIGEKLDTLKSKAERGLLASNRQEYESLRKELFRVVDEKTVLHEDLVKSNPDSVEALVTTLVNSDPKWKQRFEKAKEEVLHLMTGGKVYSQEELDHLAASGHDVQKFLKEKKSVDKRRSVELASALVHGLLLRPLIPEWSKKLRQKVAGTQALETLEQLGSNGRMRSSTPAPKKDEEIFSSIFS